MSSQLTSVNELVKTSVGDLDARWFEILREEFQAPTFHGLSEFLRKEREESDLIFPPVNLVFNAFNLCSFEDARVVILGQDPYHNPGQAMGLSFSVPRQMKIPPSLRFIYQEIEDDLHIPKATHGNLSSWASQGVLLLNATLTVNGAKEKKAGSHQEKGWEEFTDSVIQKLSTLKPALVFMLWGTFAKSKAHLIGSRHKVLESAHPASEIYRKHSFLGNQHFSLCNAFLREHGMKEINWDVNSSQS